MSIGSSRPTIEECANQLQVVAARLRTADWQPAWDVFKFVRSLQELELYGDYEIGQAMQAAVAEIKPEDYAGCYPPQLSDVPRCAGAELFAFAWMSASRDCAMYFKFCFYKNELIIHSFHREKKGRK
jgi:hypothetical protein